MGVCLLMFNNYFWLLNICILKNKLYWYFELSFENDKVVKSNVSSFFFNFCICRVINLRVEKYRMKYKMKEN